MKRLMVGWIILSGLVLGVGFIALAAPAPKVFVCKYVGTPGVNEVLQTGQNPINISSNAIPNYQGVASSFADAQGRSFVVAEDTGQTEPTCPVAQNPTPPPPSTPPPTTLPVAQPPEPAPTSGSTLSATMTKTESSTELVNPGK